ncbi:mucin-5AC-like [Homalodisca vitripennis]|uniref:mucin-5AC-like n=1 Tax=Homalodisca vitripennis TaxID=197043 RepID=UPI001EEB8532|nr:mucin-5AC-like [Homalodisca vitripennis]
MARFCYREACHEAWTNIRYSPMFGCICPNNHMKKRCDRVFTLVNHNPCIGSGPKPEENASMTFQSTCNQALELCNNNFECRSALKPVLQFCNITKCKRQNCMEALQTLYRTVDLTWSLEIAFCLCKKTKNNQDECLLAQEVLHPVCAQQVEGSVVPTCHSLAEYCRDDDTCKVRLENYEQSCAVDSVTKQCAGSPGECRKAMLGILGTALRSNCACKGTDFSQLYDCMGWQRVLWFNPCVVDSQREFHTKKMKQHSYSAPTTAVGLAVTTTTTTTPAPTTTSTTTRTTPRTTQTTMLSTTTSTTPPTTTTPLTRPPTTPTTTTTTTTTTVATTTSSTTMTTTQTTTVETTTQYMTTETTLPPRFCVVQRPHQLDQYISEGEGKRVSSNRNNRSLSLSRSYKLQLNFRPRETSKFY